MTVALVLDRSGSMAGDKLVMARAAVTAAMALLDAEDRAAVVAYDDEVETVLACATATPAAKAAAIDGIRRLDARGSTDLSAGWFRGVGEVASASPDALARVLLLTDGLANRGIVDRDELARKAAAFRAQGVTTSTFGVGEDFDETLLAGLAADGGGHFYFIERAEQIPDLLTGELGDALDTVARDVVFELDCGPGVSAMLLNGRPTDVDGGRLRVRLGDLVAHQTLTLALAVECRPRLLGSVAFVDCRIGDADRRLFPEPMRVDWQAADAAANERQPVNHEVLVSVAEVLASRARATALAANRRGDYATARAVLRGVVDHLRTIAPGNPGVLDIVAGLRRDVRTYGRPMNALDRKAKHFSAYAIDHSRAADGRPRRESPPSEGDPATAGDAMPSPSAAPGNADDPGLSPGDAR